LAQIATNPSTDFLRIAHPRFPWYIDIRQSQPKGVTIYDILTQTAQQMFHPIAGHHFYNEELSEDDRGVISIAFHSRCAGNAKLINRGVLRIDFLSLDNQKYVFVGLSRGKNGMWEMKTRRF
jgi:hypothetical protein